MSTTKRKDAEAVKDVLKLQEQMNAMSVDKINDIAPKVEDAPVEMSMKERASLENALYIEPKRTLKAFGTLPEKLKKEHAHAWEYVKGMFENYIVNTEHLTFWLCLYPGDPDCLWEIPPNRPVYVPRHVAKHLEEIMKYHTFDFIQKPESKWRPGDQMESFSPVGTHYRGKFRAIGAFA
jgi:hypothetical protein